MDTLATSGIVLADVWLGKPVVSADRSGRGLLQYVRDGQRIEVHEDGTVVVHEPQEALC